MHATSGEEGDTHQLAPSSSYPGTRKRSTLKKQSSEFNILRDAELGSDLEGLLENNFFDFDSDDDCESATHDRSFTRLQEVPNRYVSQEELDALKGCVTRRRAVFSPSPSSSPVSNVHRTYQLRSLGHSNSLPVCRKRAIQDSEANHTRQGSFEYDHLTDFDPCTTSTGNISDSVSVQFRLQGAERSRVYHGAAAQSSRAANNRTTIKRRTSFSCSIPEFLNSEAHFGSSACRVKYASSSIPCMESHAVEHNCSMDTPAVLPCDHSVSRNNSGTTRQDNTTDTFSCPVARSNSTQHYSPYHTKFNSPLLSKRQYDDSVFSLKTCDHAGSNFSLYSQTTTVSSLNDRPHCSYSKGVDCNLFKDRTDVMFLNVGYECIPYSRLRHVEIQHMGSLALVVALALVVTLVVIAQG